MSVERIRLSVEKTMCRVVGTFSVVLAIIIATWITYPANDNYFIVGWASIITLLVASYLLFNKEYE